MRRRTRGSRWRRPRASDRSGRRSGKATPRPKATATQSERRNAWRVDELRPVRDGRRSANDRRLTASARSACARAWNSCHHPAVDARRPRREATRLAPSARRSRISRRRRRQRGQHRGEPDAGDEPRRREDAAPAGDEGAGRDQTKNAYVITRSCSQTSQRPPTGARLSWPAARVSRLLFVAVDVEQQHAGRDRLRRSPRRPAVPRVELPPIPPVPVLARPRAVGKRDLDVDREDRFAAAVER